MGHKLLCVCACIHNTCTARVIYVVEELADTSREEGYPVHALRQLAGVCSY